MAATTTKIKIAARLRPKIAGEVDDDGVKVIHGLDASADSSIGAGTSYISVPNPRDPTQIFKFPLSSCYDQDSTQEAIFENDVRPLIDVVFQGVTVTIFAYGVTSSGKTHTMQGTTSQPGVIPRTLQALFDKKAGMKSHQTSLFMSYMEIYKDECYDLLVTRDSAPKLPVRENDAGMVFVANLSSEPIETVDEFDAIYSQATKHRSVGATNLNRASSRSHAVLTIEVKIFDPVEDRMLVGKINLVDLAGSENNKLTGNDPSRMAESSAINKSLSVLGQVVHALNQGASRIPYRNSKLTRVLRDALGGSSVGLLICNLAPGNKFRQDTLNTLNFAVRTKNIENKPVINERDNRPAPKPHFAAIQPPPPKLAPAVLQSVSTTGSGVGVGPACSRHSLAPVSTFKASRVPRLSSAFGTGGAAFQPMVVPGGAGLQSINEKEHDSEEPSSSRSGRLGMGLSEKEINERISKAVEAAVEAEVAKRMADLQKQREKEDAERRAEYEREWGETSERRSSKSRSPKKEHSQQLPPANLTGNELRQRIQELEQRLERDEKELRLASVISPTSKKKTGRAYVALARTHSEKGDLQVALDLYRKAETYVPDNIKLKERIMAIEYSIKNDTAFIPSPKKPKKTKKAGRDDEEAEPEGDACDDISRMPGGFGLELTNGWGTSPFKTGSWSDTKTAGSPVKPSSPLKRRLFEPDSPSKRPRMEQLLDENFPGSLC